MDHITRWPISIQLAITGWQMIYPYIGLDTYSRINLVWVLLAFFYKDLVPYVLVNSCAVGSSYYFGMLIEPRAFNYMLGENKLRGHFISVLAHILPILLLGDMIDKKIPRHVGFVTMFHHLAWGFSKDPMLCLDKIYTEAPMLSWHKMWLVACWTHMVVPWCM